MNNHNVNIQTESRQIEYQMNEINFLISLAWAEGGINPSLEFQTQDCFEIFYSENFF